MDSTYRSTAASRLRALALSLLLPLGAAAQPLNQADIPGPDGILYPDWRLAGVPGGIPTSLPVRNSATDFGAVANDSGDDTAALEAAIAAAAAVPGGGVVTLPAGTFILTRPVLIRHSNIVLRGAGKTSTKIEFRYQPPAADVAFFQPAAGVTALYNNTWIEIHADPANLERLEILAKVQGAADSTLQSCALVTKSAGNWNATFSLATDGAVVLSKTGGAGAKTLVARATFTGNPTPKETRLNCTLTNSADANAIPRPSFLGAITFCGKGVTTAGVLLTADGSRGSRTLSLPSGHGFNVNDSVQLRAPATARWDAEIQNACPTDIFRYYQFKVTATTATSVTLNQPPRIDYPVIDGANLRKISPITRCGVENLSLEQKHDVWTSGIIFSWAWECWAKGVAVTKAGRFPLYFTPAKWCELRYSDFVDAWFKGGGGTAYIGFEQAYDCLMENVTTRALRHAPLVQWSAAGNVVRNSTFTDTDAHWHAGWANENLFENCVILSNRGNGSYGVGLFSSAPDDVQHGPNGPRNAVYNCDVSSPLAGISLGGMNREWLFLHNRFAADTAPGLFARMGSGDHVLENNVFALGRPSAGILLKTADCDGIELTNNTFVGLPTVADAALGSAAPLVELNNTVVDKVTPVTFSNNGFENGLTGWFTTDDNGQTTPSSEAAYSGDTGVKVTDGSTSVGSSLYSPYLDVTPGVVYAARCNYRYTSAGGGAGLYLVFYNASYGQVGSAEMVDLEHQPAWTLADLRATAPAGAAKARIWLHSYGWAQPTLLADDFRLGSVPQALPNAGFEQGNFQWTLADGGMSSVTAEAARTGALGLKVDDRSTALGSACGSVSLPATAGRTYQVRYWCRRVFGEPGTNRFGVYLQWFNDLGNNFASDLLEVPADAEWKEYLTRAVAPAGTVSAKVYIRVYAASQATVYFDDFAFLEVPPRPTPAIPSILDWQRNPTYPLASPGFENGLTGWSNDGDNGMSSVVPLPDNTHCLRVEDDETTLGSSLKSPPFPVIPGADYQLSFRSRVLSATSGIGVYLYFRNAAGTKLGESVVNITNPATWANQSITRAAPAGATYAEIWIHSYNAAEVTAELDDFNFKAVLPSL
jgi:hypothetical protein